MKKFIRKRDLLDNIEELYKLNKKQSERIDVLVKKLSPPKFKKFESVKFYHHGEMIHGVIIDRWVDKVGDICYSIKTKTNTNFYVVAENSLCKDESEPAQPSANSAMSENKPRDLTNERITSSEALINECLVNNRKLEAELKETKVELGKMSSCVEWLLFERKHPSKFKVGDSVQIVLGGELVSGIIKSFLLSKNDVIGLFWNYSILLNADHVMHDELQHKNESDIIKLEPTSEAPKE